MKKLTVLITLSFLLVLTMGVSAQEVSMENMKMVGGVSYNTFDGTISVEGSQDENIFEDNDLDSGFGFYVGGKYNIQGNIDFVGQYERYFINDSWTDNQSGNTIDYNINLNSLVGLFSYDFMPTNNINVSLLGGPGYYFGEISTSVKEIDYDVIADFKSSIGYKLGAEVEHRLKKNLNLNANGFYRDLEMEIAGQDYETDKIDFSGFEFSVGLNYKF